jgi:dipeptidyl aminopeptidase/acylaminoacyl peptidase
MRGPLLVLAGAVAACGFWATTYAQGADVALPLGGVTFYSDRDPLGEIDLVGASGGTPRRLVLGVDFASTFSWSPDDRRLAFGRPGSDNETDLWISTSDGHARRLVRHGKDPAWSPDGRRIAFVRDRALFTIGANGRGLRNVSALLANEESPLWSPDDRRLAFLTDNELWTMTSTGKQPTRIAICVFFPPSWSPNGKRLAFNSCGTKAWHDPATAGVYVADVSGNLRRVAADTETVSWSPNGSWLALCCEDGVAVVHPDGSGYRRLAVIDFALWSYGGVSWASDSRRLTFVKGERAYPLTSDVWVASVDGDARRITDGWRGGYRNLRAIWRPGARG